MRALLRTSHLLILAVALSAGIFAFETYSLYRGKSEYLFHENGDLFSQLNAFTAGLNFSQHGFTNLFFIPVIKRYFDRAADIPVSAYYNHYPPGPDIVSGILSTAGIRDFYLQKLLLLPISLVALLLYSLTIYEFQKRDRPQCSVPLLFAAIALGSPWLIYWAGNLHQFSYWDLFAALGLWTMVTGRRKAHLAVLFIGTWFSPEMLPFLLFMDGYLLYTNRNGRPAALREGIRFLCFAVSAILAATALHFLQSVWLFHSFTEAMRDWMSSIGMRTMGSGALVYDPARHAVRVAYTLLWFYGSAVLLLCCYGAAALWKRRIFWPFAALIGGMLWQLLFLQHSMIHSFTLRHLGFGLICMAGYGAVSLAEAGSRWKKALACALVLLAIVRVPLGAQVSQNSLLLSGFKKYAAVCDSATLGSTLLSLRSNHEQSVEKIILLDELVRRVGSPTDQESYLFEFNGEECILFRVPRGYSIAERGLPKDATPPFSQDEPQLYLSTFDFYPLSISSQEPACRIRIDGKPRRLGSFLLKAYILLK